MISSHHFITFFVTLFEHHPSLPLDKSVRSPASLGGVSLPGTHAAIKPTAWFFLARLATPTERGLAF